MKIHYLQHVAFEGLGNIEPHLRARGHDLSGTQFFNNQTLPDPASIDWLIVLGGPMGVSDELLHPWLKAEKIFIKAVISSGKHVLGICLGAQLLAHVLGAAVYRNDVREIGWFPLQRHAETSPSPLATLFSTNTEVFHWHSDTFDLPNGAIALASSAACLNQGFIWQNRVVALQFHLETTRTNVQELVDHCGDDLDNSKYVQSAQELLGTPARFTDLQKLLVQTLNVIEQTA